MGNCIGLPSSRSGRGKNGTGGGGGGKHKAFAGPGYSLSDAHKQTPVDVALPVSPERVAGVERTSEYKLSHPMNASTGGRTVGHSTSPSESAPSQAARDAALKRYDNFKKTNAKGNLRSAHADRY
ncbi:hypothetical protein GGI15_002764 [Coemansia interrupta]|uniref:Uncharacterized protein n=1 Tax=Coemansia interrupta TaxID=1126814 RepID=A0A9W8HFQ9_9FUNG|nr:hypothetical protein GGI15_002764 [Coemansia interrupta]